MRCGFIDHVLVYVMLTYKSYINNIINFLFLLVFQLSNNNNCIKSFLLWAKIYLLTCSKIDNNINEKDGVRHAVEDNPSGGEVVVEERDGHRKNNQVCNK